MKQVFGAAVLVTVLSAGTAFAGNVEDPEVEPPVVVADAVNSSSGTAVAVLMTLATVLAVVVD